MTVRALVVDDSGPMRAIVVRALQAVGVTETVEARDGEEALRLFRCSVFNLVLTDLNMPKKNGIEVIRELREEGVEVPIIMLTTEAERHNVIAAIQAGVSDYLIKPFDSCLLKKKLEKLWSN